MEGTFSIFSQLPDEMIREILVYDRRFIWRENKMIIISPFSREDHRYYVLKKMPRKYNMSVNSWSVILSQDYKKRMVLGYRNVGENNEWEYFFSVFSYDSLMCQMRDYPEYAIYSPVL